MIINKEITDIIKIIDDYKGEDILNFDISKQSSDMDFVVIATARSIQHSRGIANNIKQEAKGLNIDILGIEGYEVGEWILIDLAYLVIHIMTQKTREHYNLEKIWSV